MKPHVCCFHVVSLGLSEKHPVFRILTVSHWTLKSESLGLAHNGIQITSGAYSSVGQFQLCNTFRHYISYTLKMLASLYIGDRFHSQGQRIQIRFMHPSFSVSSAWNWITFPWSKAEANAQRSLYRPIVHVQRCSRFSFRDVACCWQFRSWRRFAVWPDKFKLL